MTICLPAAATLRATAGANSALTMSVFGDEIAGGADSFSLLSQNQLTTGVVTQYTVPASTQTIVRSINVMNTTATARTFALYVNGTAAANQIAGFTIPASGCANWSATFGWQILDTTGAGLSAVSPLAASAVTFAPTGDIAATNVQAAIAEMLSEAFPLGWGAWTVFSPVLSQNGTITATTNYAKYTRIGKLIVARVNLVVTGTGTANNTVAITLPVTASSSFNADPIGAFELTDLSVPLLYVGATTTQNGDATKVNFIAAASATNVVGLPGGVFTAALAPGDVIGYQVAYEAA